MTTENTPEPTVSEMLRITGGHVGNMAQLATFLERASEEVAKMEQTIAQLQQRVAELEGQK